MAQIFIEITFTDHDRIKWLICLGEDNSVDASVDAQKIIDELYKQETINSHRKEIHIQDDVLKETPESTDIFIFDHLYHEQFSIGQDGSISNKILHCSLYL